MNVTPEMKAELGAFLGNVFEKLEITEDADKELVLESCCDFMSLVEPEVIIRDYVNVKYVGRREFYDHGKYGAWFTDQVKEVDARLAAEMLKHPDVFVKAAKDELPTDTVDPKTTEEEDELDQLQDLRDKITNARRKADVVDVVKTLYPDYDITEEMDDPRTTKLAEYRRIAYVWLDKYGLPA